MAVLGAQGLTLPLVASQGQGAEILVIDRVGHLEGVMAQRH